MHNNLEEYINKIICCNAIEELKKLPDNSIATCITDPPYNYEFIGRSWNQEEIARRTERANNSNTILVKNIPYGSGLAGGVRNARWYKKNRENILEYANWLESWGKEIFRILKPGGFVAVFNSNRTIAQVQVALENVGFYARDILIWKRNTGIPKGLNVALKMKKMGYADYQKWGNYNSSLYNMWEGIALLQKPLENNYIETLSKYNVGVLNVKEFATFQTNIFENISRDKSLGYNNHITIKPLELIEKLIIITTPSHENNIIIDPFMGSGTTAVACAKHGYKFIGFEINNEYVDICNKRLKDRE